MKHPHFHVHLLGPVGGPLSSRFDDVARALVLLPRLFFEPDGSLVWVGEDWQIDGMIYDRDGILQYADLKGHAPRGTWRTLVERIAAPDLRHEGPKHPLPCEAAAFETDVSIFEPAAGVLHDLQNFESQVWG